jgi:hypothetical protein
LDRHIKVKYREVSAESSEQAETPPMHYRSISQPIPGQINYGFPVQLTNPYAYQGVYYSPEMYGVPVTLNPYYGPPVEAISYGGSVYFCPPLQPPVRESPGSVIL